MTACTANPVDKRSRLIASVLRRILRPLVKILLRSGVPYKACAETLKSVYVDVAYQDFSIAGRKQTKSRVSVITGLSHVEVDKQLRSTAIEKPQSIRKWHRAGRVLAHWADDPEFADPEGWPSELPLEGSDKSFHRLVEKHSGGATLRAVLDELLRSKAVSLCENGQRVRLMKPMYLADASHDDSENLSLLGLSAGDLLSTIEWNIRPDQPKLRSQDQIMAENVPACVAAEASDYIRQKTDQLSREVDAHLHDLIDKHPGAPGEATISRLGLGVYYFQEDLNGTQTGNTFR